MKLLSIVTIALVFSLISAASLHKASKAAKNSHRLRGHLKKHTARQISGSASASASASASYSASSSSSSSSSVSTSSSSTINAQFLYKRSLIGDPSTVKCSVIDRAPTDQGIATSQSGSKLGKRLEMKKIRFSNGEGAYLLDITDNWFLDTFEKEVNSDFNAFVNIPANPAANIFADKQKLPTDGSKCITYDQLDAGLKKFQWDVIGKRSTAELYQLYNMEDTYCMKFREFVYMNINENVKATGGSRCTNCLKASKIEIDDFFNYLDCDKDGYVTSENFFLGFKNLKTDFPVTATMFNAFILKNMEIKTATLDIKDMQYGFLMGMFERIVFDNGVDKTSLNSMKEVRKGVVAGGNGPAFKQVK